MQTFYQIQKAHTKKEYGFKNRVLKNLPSNTAAKWFCKLLFICIVFEGAVMLSALIHKLKYELGKTQKYSVCAVRKTLTVFLSVLGYRLIFC